MGEVSTDSLVTDPVVATVARPGRAPTASACEPFRELIVDAAQRGRNAMAIWLDLVEQHGFDGRYASVRRFVGRLRVMAPWPASSRRRPRRGSGRLRRRPDQPSANSRGGSATGSRQATRLHRQTALPDREESICRGKPGANGAVTLAVGHRARDAHLLRDSLSKPGLSRNLFERAAIPGGAHETNRSGKSTAANFDSRLSTL